MKVLTNPATMQVAGLLLLVGGLLVITAVLVRSLRREMVGGNTMQVSSPRAETSTFATAAYQGVIGELKEREKALRSQLGEQTHRFAALEALHQTMLEHVGTGVIAFGPNLLVQQANTSSRKLLGYASPMNMHVKEVFRGLERVELPSSNGALGGISQAIRDVFASGAEYRGIPAFLKTPSGESRQLQISLLPIRNAAQQVTTAFCLLDPADTTFTLSFPVAEADRKTS